MSTNREIDHVTGIETTGHEWDGIKELNKPLPRWWLLTFYASIVWAIGYMIAYPAWPTLTSYTKGVLGYSQRVAIANDMKAAERAQSGVRELLAKTPLADVRKNGDLFAFARTAGNAAFQTNCAPCHGRGGQGLVGYPNLNDDDWIWGGSVDDILATIRYGIRDRHKQSRVGQMPRYGIDNMIKEAQINDVAEHVLTLSGQSADKVSADRGAVVFKEQCADCHGNDAKGKREQGSLNLTDGIWLYGGSRAAIIESIRTGRGGIMPAWNDRLDPVTLKALAVYVHSLGGGK